ncbi:SAM hydrolase/SAM-dependent halogenase family protein [Capnocytophaga canimorsus]|uniref:Uncharacterized protein n=1 Tax=Capnocytophaga canimorsus TaxID=28188 RepID=A0A0B7HBH9_9FLAO|nr:SAM-dependent chlorinase/fluorinase [Capnocytophaga canimorsus]ATA77894.1 hypothetical protein CGC47_10075 [Capnocytophaga canimorsus]PJI79792.1 hypothetical protein CLV61_1376 [Capnocytophaga canimorsus]CEN35267.1 conserved hypothetical protein [Capnocytophaga canimorsus]STA73192.1 S-adenosyl-l-methionine hydroxide adenosyltransferase [Capnocytophaga canimorsus]VEJ20136.1 S-adenosyl-l-methionine hydroxide adenosyltransferase [Capnocytophaga canimorsus]
MSIITLTTDFGERDFSVGALKGALYRLIPEARIVDISHLITPFDILQTAYILKSAYPHFPKGSIHLIGVDAEPTPDKKHLVMQLNGHFFIGADTGIFHLLSGEDSDAVIYQLETSPINNCFSVLYDFPKIISKIYAKTPLDKIGKKTENHFRMKHYVPEIAADKSAIYGKVIYIDHYGNVVSNITQTLFNEVGQGRKFEAIFSSYKLENIQKSYASIVNYNLPKHQRKNMDGEKLMLFNSNGLLELALYKSNLKTVGGASTLMGITYLDQVTIIFKNNNNK